MSDPREPDPASHIGFLDEAEDEARKKARRREKAKDADALDLDKIW